MSYFFCCYKTRSRVLQEFADIFSEIVPFRAKEALVRIKGQHSSIISYGGGKVINEIAVCDDKSGSWIVLVGTPLMKLKSQEERQSFLQAFLASPSEELLQTIDGNFAAFCYDALKDRVFAATDFNNTTPIFYSVTCDGVLFSSHELALAKLLQSEIDKMGFAQAIQLGVTWCSGTRFRNVYKMLPCQLLIVDASQQVHIEPYWRPRDETLWSGTFEEQRKQWAAYVENAVLRFYECSGRKPVICDLTAGEDSRLLLSQCHSLNIPFKAHVTGSSQDIDRIVARRASQKAKFDLIERSCYRLSDDQLLANATAISVQSDSYLEFFKACGEYATEIADPLDDLTVVKYCGLPGGEAFRGSYYLRGKAVFPSSRRQLDYSFFTRMKFLLDYQKGLLVFPDDEFDSVTHDLVKNNIEDVIEFPIGTQIDHLLRVFQTCLEGLKYKGPLYLPLATNALTRSIYCLSPRFKQGGNITKACTESLFPELACVKTQNGVPTIRRTLLRSPLFLPEYYSLIRTVTVGAASRLFKWTQGHRWYYSRDYNAALINIMLSKPPYCHWFSSAGTMVSGHLYHEGAVNTMLQHARAGTCRYVPLLGRIISQELALRWVYCQDA